MANNKPNFRVIAKATNRRDDRFDNVGVAWSTRKDDGSVVISIKFSRFANGAALVMADSVLLVPYEQRRADSQTSGAPADDAPMPDDESGW